MVETTTTNVERTINAEVAKVENINQFHNLGAITAQFVNVGDEAIRNIVIKRHSETPSMITSRAKAFRKLYIRAIESTKRVEGSPMIMDAKENPCIGKSHVEYLGLDNSTKKINLHTTRRTTACRHISQEERRKPVESHPLPCSKKNINVKTLHITLPQV